MALENGNTSVQLRGEINVTPMIDVLLVLLIIFMVIAPVLPHGLNIALPQRSINPNPKPETAIVVQITSAHNGLLRYKINQDDVSIDQIGSPLSSILSARADRVIFIKGNDDLDFSAIAGPGYRKERRCGSYWAANVKGFALGQILGASFGLSLLISSLPRRRWGHVSKVRTVRSTRFSHSMCAS